LHPSFRDPVQLSLDREHRFALTGSAWGSFPVEATLRFKDGREERISHYVNARADKWPRPTHPDLAGSARAVYDILLDPTYRWRKESTIVRRTALPAAEVAATLNNLELGGLVRKAHFEDFDGGRLWGAAALVGPLPSLFSHHSA
jgi:transcription initiation factor IIF auxiliary subunit